jgi:putative two-component system response regulator
METVLLVEDEVPVRALMTRWVINSGYQVQLAATAAEAIQEMRREPAAVAVLDIHLPGRDGLWLARELRSMYSDMSIIIASGDMDFSSAVSGLRSGAMEYLVKPLNQTQVREAIDRAMAWHRGQAKARTTREQLEHEVRTRQREFTELRTDVRVNLWAAIDLILKLLDAHAPGAYDHAKRVASLSVDTAFLVGVDEEHVTDVERAALLHDVGVLGSRRPGARAGAADAIPRREQTACAGAGHDLLVKVPFLKRAGEIIGAMDEWFDGTGAERLSDRQIPLGSRVIALANWYDELTHGPARMSSADALHEARQLGGTRFDPAIVDAFAAATRLAALAVEGTPEAAASGRHAPARSDLPLAGALITRVM